MRTGQGKLAIVATGAAFLLPPVLSLMFKNGDLGSIGPTVLIYSVMCLFLFSILYANVLIKKYKWAVAIPIGVLLGIIMAVLVLNYFMLVTYLFEIKDYNAM